MGPQPCGVRGVDAVSLRYGLSAKDAGLQAEEGEKGGVVKIHQNLQQGSWDWLTLRAGKICGSELKNLITDKLAIRKWSTEMPQSYLCRKLAEKWLGQALESFMGNRQCDQGKLWEEKARAYFSALLEVDIAQVGGIESDDKLLWCSPDGIVGETTGLEIKVPNADTQISWLLDGSVVPESHVLQIQFGIFVSGWKAWQFLSWSNNLPHLAVAVEPDAGIQSTIAEAVAGFKARFDVAWAKLCDLNGGPPPPKPAFTPSAEPIKFSWEFDKNDIATP